MLMNYQKEYIFGAKEVMMYINIFTHNNITRPEAMDVGV